MSLKIVQVSTRSQLREFIKFKVKLYKDNPYCVLPLDFDEMNILNPKKNPAFEFSQAAQFLCYREREIVGRIGVFINHRANETWSEKHGRFGWFDFIEDPAVAQLLIDTGSAWLKERGMEAMVGPLGFTDLDHEGMLIEGFDQVGTMSTLYNYPYYPEYMQQMGFKADAQWLEYLVQVPTDPNFRMLKLSEIVARRNNLHFRKFKNNKQLIKEGWGDKFFELINTAYAPLYGYVALTPEQKKSYVNQYVPFLNLNLFTCIVDDQDKMVAVGVALPSLARAMQKCKGSLLPFGFIHMLKALKAKKMELADLLLIAVEPEYQGKGVNAMVFAGIIRGLNKLGVKQVESNPELEVNEKMRNQWEGFDYKQHKRRVAFIKEI
ncbi:MAG: N-acetyltransferase [Rikenellaceae bacterium]